MRKKNLAVSQSAVEFALVIPILLMIIFGMLEMGHLVFVYASVLNASREAARYGAVTGAVGGNPQFQDCTGIVNAATRLRFLADFTAADVDIRYDQGPGSTSVGPCSAMTTGQWSAIGTGSRIVVTISSPYSLMVPLIPISNFNMVSTSARTILGSVSIAGTVVAPPSASDPPTITNVSPTSGPETGGTTVVITGTNFTGGIVSFGLRTAVCVVDSDTQITCSTPAQPAGVVDVSVVTSGGPTTSPNAFTYLPIPTVTGANPSSGLTTGGTTVEITGTNLSGMTSVTFGGTAASCVVSSATLITCISPIHIAGTVDIVVNTLLGPATLTNGFTFVAPTETVTPTLTLTPLFTRTVTMTPTITMTRTITTTPTPTVTKTLTPTKTRTPTPTSTARCDQIFPFTPTPPPTMRATATPPSSLIPTGDQLLFLKTIYNTNPDPVQVLSATINYRDLGGGPKDWIQTKIEPSNAASPGTITRNYRIVTYDNTGLYIPAGGSLTFYVLFENPSSAPTLATDLISLTVEIANTNSCVK